MFITKVTVNLQVRVSAISSRQRQTHGYKTVMQHASCLLSFIYSEGQVKSHRINPLRKKVHNETCSYAVNETLHFRCFPDDHK
jgi:hypothetical protein